MSTALNVLEISLLNPHKHDKTAFDPISLMRNRLDNLSEDAHLESGEDPNTGCLCQRDALNPHSKIWD